VNTSKKKKAKGRTTTNSIRSFKQEFIRQKQKLGLIRKKKKVGKGKKTFKKKGSKVI
jgi:hypothetical protein